MQSFVKKAYSTNSEIGTLSPVFVLVVLAEMTRLIFFRSSRRQIGRANRFIGEQECYTIEEVSENQVGQSGENREPSESPPPSPQPSTSQPSNSQQSSQQLSSSQPPKLRKRRLRSVESQAFQNVLKKAKLEKSVLCVIETKQLESENGVEVFINHRGTRHSVKIAKQITCDCSSLQIANKKTCVHIVWTFLNLFNVNEGDQLIAQVQLGSSALVQLLQKLPTSLPPHLLSINESQRAIDPKITEHPSFRKDQIWVLARKGAGSPCRCSGCLKPRIIQIGDLHLSIQGLLLLKREQKVVETTLRFCLSAACANNITSSYNNIKPLKNQAITIAPNLESVTRDELNKLVLENFNINRGALIVN